ncbi:sensor histidine kinase [Acidithiobacillus sp. CV18-2]|uniref:histidine kinase n=2 Tax=Igneacidithiobacillus copahuensis TaxID=2724909 RepID=A0AAE2YNF4_9PROT|nr:sensor histidine kinase [Acidithiobacillus sp. CV18-3]MBU2757759.1 sensor histidine kinase [Acidithiobacillus sp. BN09-2]MBU2778109.1 sensor histidine kinase [Acidithiobacillus sp. CV18-2]MBU2787254.1 sensor histidine kinase [Igneacidithiobacillus copahuensis]MBU2797273.1 sensor histidine kinase [Acidithiobacillus sp. VAN18-2]MBU2798236.1 sensor histidine kinase [Acidithiobacillus sp. VAN18-4]
MGKGLSLRCRTVKMRRLWPRSSLGRSLLLLSLLLLISQGSIYLLFHNYVFDPAAQRFAQLLWQVDQTLVARPPTELGWSRSSQPLGSIPQSYFWREVAQSFAKIDKGAQLRVQEQEGTLWVWLRGKQGQSWLGVPIQGVALIGNPFTFVRLLIMLFLILLGAWLIVWQVNRPLSRLARSAPRLLRGEYSDGYPVSPHAPEDIQELERTLAGMAADLHRLHEERTLLLTGISHELRTPLSRLLLSLHLPADEWAREQPAMLADVEEMEEVLGNFLAWVQGGEREKQITIPVAQWFQEMAAIARDRYGLEVAENLVAGGSFLCRPIALERVFRNLFDNSRRYGSGVIRLEARCEEGFCRFRLVDLGGEPLSAAMIFAMNEGSLPRQTGHGSGMGIRLCHRLLAQQGGSLHYAAATAGGLDAEVLLPSTKR